MRARPRSGAISAAIEPVELNRPANGALIPPKVSQGVDARSSFSACVASAALIGTGLLPPSMNTSPASPVAPGLPLKSQVA